MKIKEKEFRVETGYKSKIKFRSAGKKSQAGVDPWIQMINFAIKKFRLPKLP